MIRKYNIYVIAFFTAIFFTFSGYHVGLILISNLVGNESSYYFTMPIRVLILGLLLTCFLLIGKNKNVDQLVIGSFLLFSFFYILRICLEIINNSVYFISNGNILFYFLAFGFLPFLIITLKKMHPSDIWMYKNAILFSGALLALATFIFYKDLIGEVGRISLAIQKDENYVSPLALSYSGSLSMGVSLFILLTNKNSKLNVLFLLGVALISVVPFFLGSSRGSIFTLFLPFLAFILTQKNKINSFLVSLVLVPICILTVVISTYFGSTVFERFLNIEQDINSGSSAASRTILWEEAFKVFLDNPLAGKSLMLPDIGIYPHNVFLEVLMATGVLGAIPFFFLVYQGIRKTIRLFRESSEVSWMGVVFLQALLQFTFSGSIYAASWLWVSMAFVLAATTTKSPDIVINEKPVPAENKPNMVVV